MRASTTDDNAAFADSDKSNVKIYFLTVPKLDEYKFLVQSEEAVNTRLTVGKYSKKFLFYKSQQVIRKKLKQTTYDRIERTFESHIEPHPIAQILMCNLKSRDIQNLLDEMQPNYSLSTINKVYLFLHSMVKHGKEEQDFPESYNPFNTVELPDETAVGKKQKKYRYFPRNVLNVLKRLHWNTILMALSHTVMDRLWFLP